MRIWPKELVKGPFGWLREYSIQSFLHTFLFFSTIGEQDKVFTENPEGFSTPTLSALCRVAKQNLVKKSSEKLNFAIFLRVNSFTNGRPNYTGPDGFTLYWTMEYFSVAHPDLVGTPCSVLVHSGWASFTGIFWARKWWMNEVASVENKECWQHKRMLRWKREKTDSSTFHYFPFFVSSSCQKR